MVITPYLCRINKELIKAMRMRLDKQDVAMGSAVMMLISGGVLTYLNMYLPPVGEISSSVLWYTGQCFLYCGGIFGIGAWARQVVKEEVGTLKRGQGYGGSRVAESPTNTTNWAEAMTGIPEGVAM